MGGHLPCKPPIAEEDGFMVKLGPSHIFYWKAMVRAQ